MSLDVECNWLISKCKYLLLHVTGVKYITAMKPLGDRDTNCETEQCLTMNDILFSKTGISLSVNKVGKTLLLDEFDVPSVLSHAAQVTQVLLRQYGNNYSQLTSFISAIINKYT